MGGARIFSLTPQVYLHTLRPRSLSCYLCLSTFERLEEVNLKISRNSTKRRNSKPPVAAFPSPTPPLSTVLVRHVEDSGCQCLQQQQVCHASGPRNARPALLLVCASRGHGGRGWGLESEFLFDFFPHKDVQSSENGALGRKSLRL